MKTRLAVMEDLPEIKSACQEIVRQMKQNRIQIWDDYYPGEFFETDIRNRRLYLMEHETEPVAVFALCHEDAGENSIKWEKQDGRALYLDRFFVSVHWQGTGAGRRMLDFAKEAAKTLGAEYLRLFVVDANLPAIRLYSGNGFVRKEGLYRLAVDEGLILHEYGYEKRL